MATTTHLSPAAFSYAQALLELSTESQQAEPIGQEIEETVTASETADHLEIEPVEVEPVEIEPTALERAVEIDPHAFRPISEDEPDIAPAPETAPALSAETAQPLSDADIDAALEAVEIEPVDIEPAPIDEAPPAPAAPQPVQPPTPQPKPVVAESPPVAPFSQGP